MLIRVTCVALLRPKAHGRLGLVHYAEDHGADVDTGNQKQWLWL